MAIAGRGGSVKFDDGDIAEMSNWSINPTVDEIDTTNFDSGEWKAYMAGLKEWTFSFEGNLVKGHVASLINKIGKTAQVELKVTATDGDITFSGQGFITGVDVDMPVDDKATISADGRGAGAMTAV